MANIVDTLTDPMNIAAVLAGGACFAAVLTVASPCSPKTSSARG